MTLLEKAARFCVMAAVMLLYSASAAAFEPPVFQGDVLDEAGVLSAPETALVASQIAQLREKADIWAAVYVAKALDGTTIEDAANQTFRAWGLGQTGKNNGLLVLIVPAAREVRIEVGYGWKVC